jgi:hypothetical protein
MAEDELLHDLSFIGEKQFQIRRVWNTEQDEWFYSVADVIAVLVPDSPDPSSYWRMLKRRLKEEERFGETAAQIVQNRRMGNFALPIQRTDKHFFASSIIV